jgi:iron complex outermembrane receptor protein
LARSDDAEFSQLGLFGEAQWSLGDDNRIIAGLRMDDWQVEDQRRMIPLSMMTSVAHPQAGMQREDTLHSGFLRYEDTIGASGFTWYAGVGHNERFPDYWELTKETATALAATASLEAERNTQIDTGLLFRNDKLQASLSLFHSNVDDYMMIQSGVMKQAMAMGGMPGMGMPALRSTSIVRNIDAHSWGVEFDSQYRFATNWRAELSLASVRGANDTDGTTLAQLPPLEARFGVYYDRGDWTAGVLWRSLASQQRVDIGKGNIVGQDFGPTSAADILSFNAGWRATQQVLVTAGIDNLLDATYAEHVSRAGAMIPGFDQIARINEPGRTLWMKAQYSF